MSPAMRQWMKDRERMGHGAPVQRFRVTEHADDGEAMGARYYLASDSMSAARQYSDECVLGGVRPATRISIEPVAS